MPAIGVTKVRVMLSEEVNIIERLGETPLPVSAMRQVATRGAPSRLAR
jgi:hypothetical protein